MVNLPLPTASPQQLALPPPAAAALAQAIAQLAAALRNRETAARAAAVRLRRLLALHNRGWELDGLERQLGSYDFESAEVELMRLSARWGVAI